MRNLRTLALAITLGLAASAYAQSGGNPISRGGADRDPFGSGSIANSPRDNTIGSNTFGQSGLRRPPTRVVSVTPVPEPGQWAMMLAGLGLVGWIVRRNTRR